MKKVYNVEYTYLLTPDNYMSFTKLYGRRYGIAGLEAAAIYLFRGAKYVGILMGHKEMRCIKIGGFPK